MHHTSRQVFQPKVDAIDTRDKKLSAAIKVQNKRLLGYAQLFQYDFSFSAHVLLVNEDKYREEIKNTEYQGLKSL